MNKDILKKQKIVLKDIKKKLYLSVIPLSVAILILSGCSNNNSTKETVKDTKPTVKEEVKTNTETETTTTNKTEETTTESIDKDTTVLNEFENYKNEVLNSNDQSTFKEKGKAFFIKTVDFIFYDGDIKGVTFKELKDSTREAIYNGLCDMDELIMEVAPNYKENISSKYDVVKDFTKKAYYSSLDKIKELIGEEKYDKITELKNSLKEKAGNVAEKAGEKAKEYKNKLQDWYQNYKEK